MRISWIHDELDSELREESEDRIFKPAWRLAEGFEKSHGLQCRNKADRASALDEHTLVRCEEINFHKIAIRYSANLSKDCVFSCLRHIFHRIGKTMATGQEVRVFCGCGDFVAKERKADFVFDTHYHRFVVRALSSEEEDAQVPRAPVRGAPACLVRRNLQRTSGPACLVRRNLQRTSGSFVLTEPRRAACPGRRRRCGRLATPSRRSRSRCASRSRGTSRPRARRTRRRPGAPRSRARHMR